MKKWVQCFPWGAVEEECFRSGGGLLKQAGLEGATMVITHRNRTDSHGFGSKTGDRRRGGGSPCLDRFLGFASGLSKAICSCQGGYHFDLGVSFLQGTICLGFWKGNRGTPLRHFGSALKRTDPSILLTVHLGLQQATLGMVNGKLKCPTLPQVAPSCPNLPQVAPSCPKLAPATPGKRHVETGV